MNGIEVCEALRAEPSTAHIPIILLTAKAQEAELTRGLAAGAHDYIVKPFSPNDLLSRVKHPAGPGRRRRCCACPSPYSAPKSRATPGARAGRRRATTPRRRRACPASRATPPGDQVEVVAHEQEPAVGRGHVAHHPHMLR